MIEVKNGQFFGDATGAAEVIVNDSLIVEQGGTAANIAVGANGSLSNFGTADIINVFNGGYAGVGMNGTTDWVQVFNGGTFEVFNNATVGDLNTVAAEDVIVHNGGIVNAWGGVIESVSTVGYLGVGGDAVVGNVTALAGADTDIWGSVDNANIIGSVADVYAWGDIAFATIVGDAAGNLGVVNVHANAESYNATVTWNGQLHVVGAAYDTAVNGNGYVGVGFGGHIENTTIAGNGALVEVFAGATADDVTVRQGDFVVYGDGFAEDVAVRGGAATVLAGGLVDFAQVSGGQFVVAGMGGVNDIDLTGNILNRGHVTFYNGANVTGEIEIDGGSINTFGVAYANAGISIDMTGAGELDKVCIDDLANIKSAYLEIEVNSRMDEGRYLIAGNASAFYGSNLTLTDSDSSWAVTIGGYGQYMDGDRTYRFDIDANDNLYMDVIDGFAVEYAGNNTLGAGDFNGDGNAQQIWYNALTNSMVIEGIAGEIACMGDFAGVGDFNGDNFDDILFTSGDTINVMYFGNVGGNIGILTGINYGEVLGGGTVDNFQIGDFDNDFFDTDEIYVKRAEGFYDVATLVADDNGDLVPEFKIIGSTTCVMDN